MSRRSTPRAFTTNGRSARSPVSSTAHTTITSTGPSCSALAAPTPRVRPSIACRSENLSTGRAGSAPTRISTRLWAAGVPPTSDSGRPPNSPSPASSGPRRFATTPCRPTFDSHSATSPAPVLHFVARPPSRSGNRSRLVRSRSSRLRRSRLATAPRLPGSSPGCAPQHVRSSPLSKRRSSALKERSHSPPDAPARRGPRSAQRSSVTRPCLRPAHSTRAPSPPPARTLRQWHYGVRSSGGSSSESKDSTSGSSPPTNAASSSRGWDEQSRPWQSTAVL